MLLDDYFMVGDVIEFPAATTPIWAKGKWRVAGLAHRLSRGEQAEIMPLTDDNELDADRAISARYFVIIDSIGRSGLEMQELRLASEAE